MGKEDLELILEILKESKKDSRELKKLISKIEIFVERHKLDEEYQKNMQSLASRMQELDPIEDENN